MTVLPWKDPPIIRAVDEVDFKIMPNQIFGLAGESGCGKSTIARLLIGAINKTQGEILFKGKKMEDYPQEKFDHVYRWYFKTHTHLLIHVEELVISFLIHWLFTPLYLLKIDVKEF